MAGRGRRTAGIAGSFAALALSVLGPTVAAPTAVAAPAGLGVSGNSLTLAGAPFMPRGFTLIGAMAGPTCPPSSSPDLAAAASHLTLDGLTTLHDVWHANTVRFQVSQTELTGTQADVATYVAALQQDVGWAHTAHLEVVLSMNDLGLGCGPSHHLPSAATWTAWQVLAPAFAVDPDVMFELFNEPVTQDTIDKKPVSGQPLPTADWTQWASGGTSPDPNLGDGALGEQDLVDGLRALHLTNVLVADGLNRAGILPGPHQGSLLTDPLQRLAYAIHPYSDTAGVADWDFRFGDTSASVPVVATEWNYTTGQCGAAQQTVAPGFLGYLSARGIGVLGYAADEGVTAGTPALIADWAWDPRPCPTTPGVGPGFDFSAYLASTAAPRPSAVTIAVPATGPPASPVAGSGTLTLAGQPAPAGLQVTLTRTDSGGTTVLPSVVTTAAGTYAFTDTPSRGLTTYTAGYPGNAVTAPATSAPATVSVPQLPTYVPVAPCRLLDTRGGATLCPGAALRSAAPVKGGGVVTVPVVGVAGVPSGASSVVLSLTAVGATKVTTVTAYPAGSPRPAVVSLSVAGPAAESTLVVVPVGTGGRIALFNHAGSVNLLADVVGYFGVGVGSGGGPAGSVAPVEPCRLLDTRGSSPLCSGVSGVPIGKVPAGGTLTVQVAGSGGAAVLPVGATAVVVDLTARGASGPTTVTAFAAGAVRPRVPTLNASGAGAVSTLAVVPLGPGGAISLSATGAVDLSADLVAAVVPGPAAGYTAVPGCRVLDTRGRSVLCSGSPALPIGKLKAGASLTLSGLGGVPADATAVVLDLTAVGASTPTQVTAYAAGSSPPPVTCLAVSSPAAVSNLAVVPLGPGGSLTFAVGSGSLNLAVDLVGYLSP